MISPTSPPLPRRLEKSYYDVMRYMTFSHEIGLTLCKTCSFSTFLQWNLIIFLLTWLGTPIFSSPEPKAQVSYCHSALSVVRPSVNFHIFDFFSRTAWWILMKLCRDEVLIFPYKCCCFSTRSAKERIQGGAKIGHGGSPSSRIFFFRPEGYSDKPNG